jgi:hypothetical protein
MIIIQEILQKKQSESQTLLNQPLRIHLKVVAQSGKGFEMSNIGKSGMRFS